MAAAPFIPMRPYATFNSPIAFNPSLPNDRSLAPPAIPTRVDSRPDFIRGSGPDVFEEAPRSAFKFVLSRNVRPPTTATASTYIAYFPVTFGLWSYPRGPCLGSPSIPMHWNLDPVHLRSPYHLTYTLPTVTVTATLDPTSAILAAGHVTRRCRTDTVPPQQGREERQRCSSDLTRLDDSDPLVRLHRKFWLQSLQDVESMNINEDEDPDEEGEGGETVHGCYILNIGIKSIWPELLVRKEYIRLYQYCNKYLGSNRNWPMPPSVVITGQPGIGKSYWLTYALCQRLVEGEPVIWFSDTRRYLFVNEGVFEIPPDYPSTKFKTLIWTLIDADDSKNGIPDYLAPP
ncbi:hypothetical protein EDB86DRAFT_3129050 [Lactarius hatsudake]|nr:hypothetical protein EDB86DRAFT_3129050 [Lactarius hatsudake]